MEPIRIVIEVDEAGRVRMAGPLENKVVCLGLLDIARQLVHEHAPNQAGRPSVVMPNPGAVSRIIGK